jgi:hypothetical protein
MISHQGKSLIKSKKWMMEEVGSYISIKEMGKVSQSLHEIIREKQIVAPISEYK